MSLPLFFHKDIDGQASSLFLEEATSKHVVQVLRMQVGKQLQLTDGKGLLCTVEIKDDHRKKCEVTIIQSQVRNKKSNITIAISPLKNSSRFEWFLEKATEIGVTNIVPLLCERTEKQHLKWERMQGILISAMLQSQQVWLPVLSEPIKFTKYVSGFTSASHIHKMIAHCEDENNRLPLQQQVSLTDAQLILIGPEGDFNRTEIELAIQTGFVPVSLGSTRLRTETAGIVAATLLCNP